MRARRPHPGPGSAGLVIAVLLLTTAVPALAQPDLDPPEPTRSAEYDEASTAWNGLSTFANLITGFGLTFEPRTNVDLADLTAEDILVVLYPTKRLDPGGVAGFVRAGGRLLIADDFGEASEALARLGMLRGSGDGGIRADRFQDGRLFAPIAEVLDADHPLAADVDEIVTNHPAILEDVRGADAVFGFDGDQAVVVAGDSEAGRFVVLSDPSLFINRMLEFDGNLQLAVNTLRWLARHGVTPSRRVVLLHGDFSLFGEPSALLDDGSMHGTVASLVDDIDAWLDEQNDYLLSATRLKVLAAIVALLVALACLLALPVRRGPPLDGAWARGPQGTGVAAGPTDLDELIGRFDRAAPHAGTNLMLPAAVLRDAVQTALARVVERPDPLYTLGEGELVAAVESRHGPAAASSLRSLYARLRALPGRAQAAAPWSNGHLSRREFERLHDDVRELYRTLGEEREPR